MNPRDWISEARGRGVCVEFDDGALALEGDYTEGDVAYAREHKRELLELVSRVEAAPRSVTLLTVEDIENGALLTTARAVLDEAYSTAVDEIENNNGEGVVWEQVPLNDRHFIDIELSPDLTVLHATVCNTWQVEEIGSEGVITPWTLGSISGWVDTTGRACLQGGGPGDGRSAVGCIGRAILYVSGIRPERALHVFEVLRGFLMAPGAVCTRRVADHLSSRGVDYEAGYLGGGLPIELKRVVHELSWIADPDANPRPGFVLDREEADRYGLELRLDSARAPLPSDWKDRPDAALAALDELLAAAARRQEEPGRMTETHLGPRDAA